MSIVIDSADRTPSAGLERAGGRSMPAAALSQPAVVVRGLRKVYQSYPAAAGESRGSSSGLARSGGRGGPARRCRGGPKEMLRPVLTCDGCGRRPSYPRWAAMGAALTIRSLVFDVPM